MLMRHLFCLLVVVVISPSTCWGEKCLESALPNAGCCVPQCASQQTGQCKDCGCGKCGAISEFPRTLAELLHCDEDNWLQIGGFYRARHHIEDNMRRAGLTGQDDEFTLHLTRLWLDAEVNDWLSIRLGMMDAASFGESIRPRNNEVNRSDLYQLYADVLLTDSDNGALTARLGRQEMRYGSARLIMAPGWANRRRTHDGARMMWRGDDWEVDGFWVRPAVRNASTFTSFDDTNEFQQLYGVFSTYKGLDVGDLELYWLAYDVEQGAGSGPNGAQYDTFGSRYFGSTDDFLFEVEGGYQIGTNHDDSSHSAGFFVGGIAKEFEEATWKPTIWFYYDWASGSDTVGNGFHPYVTRAHFYNGHMDMFGRRNLHDFNIRLETHPSEKVNFWIWYHYFRLVNGNDVPYNLSMNPFANLPAGSAGSKDLGHEIDFILTWDINDQAQIRVAYHHFWSGRFYDTTPGVPFTGDADFFYTHFQYKF